MSHPTDLLLTALAPAIWGSSYIVATQMLPNLDPLSVSLLRALPAGLVLLLIVRTLPPLSLVPRLMVLGALNFSVFWVMLFVAAYRLPGGVAAVLGALQPFVVIIAARALLGTKIRPMALCAVAAGILGVAILILGPDARLDVVGIVAGLLGSASMAFGIVLSRKWQPAVPTLTFTAWQLTAGGILLLPVLILSPVNWGSVTPTNLIGLAYLSLIGAGLTYAIWFRGIRVLSPTAVSFLGFLSPITATLLGWSLLGETLTIPQLAGMTLVFASIFVGQHVSHPRT